MKDNINPYILCIAAVIAAIYFFQDNLQLQAELRDCNSKYEGFREGIIYGSGR